MPQSISSASLNVKPTTQRAASTQQAAPIARATAQGETDNATHSEQRKRDCLSAPRPKGQHTAALETLMKRENGPCGILDRHRDPSKNLSRQPPLPEKERRSHGMNRQPYEGSIRWPRRKPCRLCPVVRDRCIIYTIGRRPACRLHDRRRSSRRTHKNS